jgi:hypothetical protein
MDLSFGGKKYSVEFAKEKKSATSQAKVFPVPQKVSNYCLVLPCAYPFVFKKNHSSAETLNSLHM